MKYIVIAAAVLVCAIMIPTQAFSYDGTYNYKPAPTNLQHKFWFGYSNRTLSFDYSDKTVAFDYSDKTTFGYSSSTHDDERDGNDNHNYQEKQGPNCLPLINGRGYHLGERNCLDVTSYGNSTHTWIHASQSEKNTNGILAPENNKHNLNEIFNQISHNHSQGPDITHKSKHH
ncbi:MAG TPA: hypothetical protein VJ771_06840 [Candidatus Nitrosotalea sp.]|nr:hypothetical protein [Candidatus Nitrosotalea sp.]